MIWSRLTIALFSTLSYASFAQPLSQLSWGTDSTLEVVSWNIERYPKSGSTTVDSVGEIIAALDVDIWALQEINDSNQLKQAIAHLPDYRAVFGKVSHRGLAYLYNIQTIKQVNVYQLFTQSQYQRPLPRAPLVIEFEYADSSFKVVNNHYKCCGNGTWDKGNSNDEETRRYNGHRLIMDYADSLWKEDKVMVVGDLNDILTDNVSNNIFQKELDDTANYRFVDLSVAQSPSGNWSYPSWPSHLDHILITKALLPYFHQTSTEVSCIKVDQHLSGGWSEYDSKISDHRPVGYKFGFENSAPDTSTNDTLSVVQYAESSENYRIYPNPTTGPITIAWDKGQKTASIEVVNVLGRTVGEVEFIEAPISNKWTLELPKPGVYVARILQQDGSSHQIQVLFKD